MVERAGGALEIKGSARDAADLSEFVKRMRVSARFKDVTHPQYTTQKAKNENTASFITFTLSARVAYWD